MKNKVMVFISEYEYNLKYLDLDLSHLYHLKINRPKLYNNQTRIEKPCRERITGQEDVDKGSLVTWLINFVRMLAIPILICGGAASGAIFFFYG